MRCDEIFGQGSESIGEIVLDDFLYISKLTSKTNYGFDNELYPKSFMSLVLIKDYMYVITDDGKIS